MNKQPGRIRERTTYKTHWNFVYISDVNNSHYNTSIVNPVQPTIVTSSSDNRMTKRRSTRSLWLSRHKFNSLYYYLKRYQKEIQINKSHIKLQDNSPWTCKSRETVSIKYYYFPRWIETITRNRSLDETDYNRIGVVDF